MGHKWTEVPKTMATFLDPRKRVCEHCGACQEEITEQVWGRTVRRFWHPKAGKCLGKK